VYTSILVAISVWRRCVCTSFGVPYPCAKLWNYPTGTVDSSPAVVNGMVYVGSSDGNLYALDASTGALLWSYTTGGLFRSSPTVAKGVVYVGSWDHNVYALNASTGAKVWSYTTGDLSGSRRTRLEPPVPQQEKVSTTHPDSLTGKVLQVDGGENIVG
jgi:outer membrane protein assembly factor BamB